MTHTILINIALNFTQKKFHKKYKSFCYNLRKKTSLLIAEKWLANFKIRIWINNLYT